jgi:outer membrane protein TolC
MHKLARLFPTFAVAAVLAAPLAAGSPQDAPARHDTVSVTLESAVRAALEGSPDLLAVVARQDFAGARLNFARAHRFLTDFTATSAQSTAPGLKNDEGIPRDALYLDPDVRNDWDDLSPFNRLEVELTQPIFTWGEISGSVSAAAHGIDVEEAAVAQQELEVALRTGRLYYGMLLAEALGRLAAEAEDIVGRAIGELESQIEEGATDVDEADLFQVQIAEQEVIRRVVEVEQRLHTARSGLARQMLLPEGAVTDAGDRILAPVPFELDDLSVYSRIALMNRPELAGTDAGLEAREALVRVARSDYYPKLFLAATARYGYAADRYRQRNPYVSDPFLSRSVQAGLGFRQNLNFAQTSAKVEQARSEAAEVRHQGDAARQLVLFEVEEAYRNVIVARTAVETGDEALLISREWLQSEEINFDLDIGDAENLVRAVQSNLELQAAQNQFVHDYNLAVLRLLKATGTLSQVVLGGTFVE